MDGNQLVGCNLAGRYRVTRVIGRGGMGVVYEAVRLDDALPVAVKVLLDLDPRAVARFRHEALATAKLGSKNVVVVSDFQEPPGEPPFLVMELLDGEPLRSLLCREGPLPPKRAVAITKQVLRALSAAHRAGIVHRDVKPSNVFVLKRDVIKLLDFGVAKIFQGGMKTTTGVILGTPAYLAPEQVLGGPVGPWTDVHAVGILLYEMLTGTRPWRTNDLGDVVYSPPAPPVGVRPELASIVMRALAKDPKDRFPSADAMAAELGPRSHAAMFGAAFGVTLLVSLAIVVAVAVHRHGGAVAAARPDAAPLATVTSSIPEVVTSPPVRVAEPDADRSPADAQANGAADAAPVARREKPVLDHECVCAGQLSGERKTPLCQVPQTPRCWCMTSDHESLCRDPYVADGTGGYKCKGGDDTFGGPGKKKDDVCVGYRRPTGQNFDMSTGYLTCSLCYDVLRTNAAIHGTPCRGVDWFGERSSGAWDCSVRAAR